MDPQRPRKLTEEQYEQVRRGQDIKQLFYARDHLRAETRSPSCYLLVSARASSSVAVSRLLPRAGKADRCEGTGGRDIRA
jgi:hypothetical protein